MRRLPAYSFIWLLCLFAINSRVAGAIATTYRIQPQGDPHFSYSGGLAGVWPFALGGTFNLVTHAASGLARLTRVQFNQVPLPGGATFISLPGDMAAFYNPFHAMERMGVLGRYLDEKTVRFEACARDISSAAPQLTDCRSLEPNWEDGSFGSRNPDFNVKFQLDLVIDSDAVSVTGRGWIPWVVDSRSTYLSLKGAPTQTTFSELTLPEPACGNGLLFAVLFVVRAIRARS